MSRWSDIIVACGKGVARRHGEPMQSEVGSSASQQVLMLTSRPWIRGPLPKIAPLQIAMLEAQGYAVDVAYWGSRFDDEPVLRKLFAGPLDLAKALRALKSGSHGILFVNTAHDFKTLLRDIPLLCLTRRRGVRRIVLLHGSLAERLTHPRSWAFKSASGFMVRSADAILLLSAAELEIWRAFEPRGRYFGVVNPFVPSQELKEAALKHEAVMSSTERAREVLFVGRLVREKGVIDLVEAMRLVNEELPCRLVIAGTGPVKDQLTVLVQDSGLGSRIDLCGYMDAGGLATAYASAEVFVLPTYWDEGFPTVIAEAMSVGLPIITTRIRGAADLLTEGENCLYTAPRDPTELATCILTLLKDDGLARRMSAANRALAETLRPAAVGAAYTQAFESSVGIHD